MSPGVECSPPKLALGLLLRVLERAVTETTDAALLTNVILDVRGRTFISFGSRSSADVASRA